MRNKNDNLSRVNKEWEETKKIWRLNFLWSCFLKKQCDDIKLHYCLSDLFHYPGLRRIEKSWNFFDYIINFFSLILDYQSHNKKLIDDYVISGEEWKIRLDLLLFFLFSVLSCNIFLVGLTFTRNNKKMCAGLYGILDYVVFWLIKADLSSEVSISGSDGCSQKNASEQFLGVIWWCDVYWRWCLFLFYGGKKLILMMTTFIWFTFTSPLSLSNRVLFTSLKAYYPPLYQKKIFREVSFESEALRKSGRRGMDTLEENYRSPSATPAWLDTSSQKISSVNDRVKHHLYHFIAHTDVTNNIIRHKNIKNQLALTRQY